MGRDTWHCKQSQKLGILTIQAIERIIGGYPQSDNKALLLKTTTANALTMDNKGWNAFYLKPLPLGSRFMVLEGICMLPKENTNPTSHPSFYNAYFKIHHHNSGKKPVRETN